MLELTKLLELFVTRKNQSHFKASLQGWAKKKLKGVLTVTFFAKLCRQKNLCNE